MENEKNKRWYIRTKKVYSFLLKVLYKPEVLGKENIPKEGAIIFAGNHKNAVDPTVLMASTDRLVHFIAKKEAFKGLHGVLFKNIGLIPINRTKGSPGAIKMAENILNEGGTIGIFPEGTRNKTENDLLPFKLGAVTMAKKTNAKIIPFAIKGKYKLFRKGLKIEIGKPISVTNLEKEEANKILENEILKLLKR